MKLEQLAAKPRLIKITMDNQEIVDEYGDVIEFWTWDRQPMKSFVKLAAIDTNNYASVLEAVKELVLTEEGKPIISDENMLPTKILMLCITKIVEGLGKS